MLTAWDANMEVVYKVIPSFKSKDSNITCVFVGTGFPENRSKFFIRVWDDESDNQEKEYERDGAQTDEEKEFVEQKPQPGIKWKIEGREGTYKEAVTAMDKYVMQPKILKFAISYVHANKVPKQIVFDKDGVSNEDSCQSHPNMFHLKHQEIEN